MTVLVDTSVWSLALRRDAPPHVAEVEALRRALGGTELVATTGLILQELLQGAAERSRALIAERFAVVRIVAPDRDDHAAAADLWTHCRRAGVQLGTVDALVAQLCLRHDLTLLTTDRDLTNAARHVPLRLWSATPGTGT